MINIEELTHNREDVNQEESEVIMMADADIRLYEPMQEEKVIEIEIERLRDFHDHPFKIREDRQMKSLMESVEKYGILTPLTNENRLKKHQKPERKGGTYDE